MKKKKKKKKKNSKNVLRGILWAILIILTILLILLLATYLIYKLQIKPEKEKINRANQVVDFIEYYDREIINDEIAELEEVLREDEDLYALLQEGKYNGEVEYRQIIKRRIEIYQEAVQALKSAKVDIDTYEKNGEINGLQKILSQSLDERNQAYIYFIEGFEKDLVGQSGDNEFAKGRESLNKVMNLEKEATQQLNSKMKEIIGEQEYRQMVESGEIKGQY